MKSGKASGESGILPEMVRAACCEPDFMSRLLELVHDVWRTGKVPRDWCDAILVPMHSQEGRPQSIAETIGGGFLFWMWLARWLLSCCNAAIRRPRTPPKGAASVTRDIACRTQSPGLHTWTAKPSLLLNHLLHI